MHVQLTKLQPPILHPHPVLLANGGIMRKIGVQPVLVRRVIIGTRLPVLVSQALAAVLVPVPLLMTWADTVC